jgi:hypothetical protein
MEKTAVEQFKESIEKHLTENQKLHLEVIYNHCLEMGKQQIIDAYACGVLNECSGTNVRSDEYYNQTYKSK